MGKKKYPCSPDGGHLPPNPKKLEAFWKKVQEEAKQLFGVNEEGTATVAVDLHDRARFERQQTLPMPVYIPYSWHHPYGDRKWQKMLQEQRKASPDPLNWIPNPEQERLRKTILLENRLDRKRMAEGNAQIMTEYLRTCQRDEEIELREQLESDDKERATTIKQLTALEEKWKDPLKYYRDFGYQVDEENMTYISHARPDRVSYIQKPKDFDEKMALLKKLRAYKAPKRMEF